MLPLMPTIDRAGVPFILAPAALALLCAVFGWVRVSFLLAVAALFMLWFFRDPERNVPSDSSLVVSPADGRVVVAGEPEPGVAPQGVWRQVSIFLSPLDVHVNRIPFGGTVTRVEFRPGRFLAAFRPESARENERSELWLERAGHRVVARQVVGVLARRVVCRAREGDVVATGQRFGLMKFGSRMDVFVPEHWELLARPGDRVRGGETPIARLAEPAR